MMTGALVLALALPQIASAQAAPDEQAQQLGNQLGECITAKASAEDKPVLAKWVAVELSAAPLLTGVVTIDAAKREELDKAAAQVFTRLVTVDCADLSKQLMRSDGRSAFRSAGAALDRLAIRELIATPGVNSGIVRSYVSKLNQDDFRKLIQP